MEYSHTTGLVAALTAAMVWAIASITFRKLGEKLHPLVLNLYKGVVALVILVVFLAARGQLAQSVPFLPLCLLLAGGIIGIGIGDTALFASLNRLGERQTILISQSGAPVITVMIATALFREYLAPASLLGISAIIGGVLWVVSERPQNLMNEGGTRRASGIVYGFRAAICQATGAVLSRAAFRMHDIDPTWSALIRLAGATAAVLLFMPLAGQRLLPGAARSVKVWRVIIYASALGAVGGITFQQIAFKYTFTAVAQTAITMCAVFVLVAARIRGERTSPRAWAGALLAVAGVGLLFWTKDASI
jgi:drug/metabolite transporter (DMT)-like permease